MAKKGNILDNKEIVYGTTTLDQILTPDGKEKWKPASVFLKNPLPVLNEFEYKKNKIYLNNGELYFIGKTDGSAKPLVNLLDSSNLYLFSFYGINDNYIYLHSGLSFETNGKLFVYDIQKNSVETILNGQIYNRQTTSTNSLIGNYLYTSISSKNAISRIDLTTKTLTTIPINGIDSGDSIGEHFFYNNYIYFPIVSYGTGSRRKYFYRASLDTMNAEKLGSKFMQCGQFAVVYKDKLYTNNYSKGVWEINLETFEEKLIVPNFALGNEPFAIDDNFIYSADKENKLILKTSIKTGESFSLQLGELTDANFEIFYFINDGKGTVYFMNYKKCYALTFIPSYKWKKITAVDVE